MAKRSVPVRMEDEDKAKWMAAAESDGLSFAAWLRNACNAYCVKESIVTDAANVDVLIHPRAVKSPDVVAKPKVKRSGPVSALEAFKHMLPPD